MHANVVIGLLMLTLVLQAAHVLRMARFRARLRRLEGKEFELFQSLTEVRGWVRQETRSGQGEIRCSRVLDSAAPVRTRRQKELAPVLEKLADAEVAEGDDAATTVFDSVRFQAELHGTSRRGAEEERERDETTPQGACEVTLVTVVGPGEKEET
ncbi:MAG: hypothetical protein ACMG6S_22120 [Byssovorax sp.]